MKTKITLLIVSLSQIGYAQTYLNWGFAVDYPDKQAQYSDVQNYALGVIEPLNSKFEMYAEAGGWKDRGTYPGALSAVYTTFGVSLDLKLQEHYVSYSLGPACVLPYDTILGSPWQIYHKLSFGVRENDKRIGLFIKHFSNAGLLGDVNIGRQFVGLEVAF